MGLGSVSVSGPGGGGTQAFWCSTTTNYDQCPQVWTFAGITYTAPEGTSTYTPSSTDIVGNAKNGTTWTVNVDRTAPTGSFTNVPTYTNGTANITGAITDALSGPQDAKVQYQAPGSGTWVDACARQTTTSAFTCNWNTAGLADGTYKVRGELRDKTTTPNVGYTASADIVVDDTPAQQLQYIAPAVGSQGASDRLEENNLTEIRFSEQDTTSGVAQTTLEYNTATDGSENGQWLAADAAEATGQGQTSTLWETSEVPDGLHEVRATTKDRAGNAQTTKFHVVAAAGRTTCGTGNCYAGLGFGVATPTAPAAPPAPPCDRYAAPADAGGSNSNDGSLAHPYLTLRKLWDELTASNQKVGCLRQSPTGKPIEIPDGVNGGKLENPYPVGTTMTLRSAPNEEATLKGRLWLYGYDITVRDLVLDSRNLDNEGSCDFETYTTCQNPSPTVQGDRDQLLNNEITTHAELDHCSDASSANNTAPCDTPTSDPELVKTHGICVNLTRRDTGQVDPQNKPIKVPASDVLIKGNYIHDCGVPTKLNEKGGPGNSPPKGGHWHGIYVASAVKTRISYNTFFHNGDRAVQLNPDADQTTVDHNTAYQNGFGFQVGNETITCGNAADGPCSGNNKFTNNIVAESRNGTNELRYYSQNESIYNAYYRRSDDGHIGTGNAVTKGCFWESYSKDGGFYVSDAADHPLTFTAVKSKDPKLYRAANDRWISRAPDCLQYGAAPQTFRGWGLRDNLTAPNFQPGPGAGHTWAVAARIWDGSHPSLETGLANRSKCGTSATKWRAYIRFQMESDGTLGWRCGASLNPSEKGFFAAMITSGNSDRVIFPKRTSTGALKNRVVTLGKRKYPYIPLHGVHVDAFGKTDTYGRDIGGVWSAINYLTGPAPANPGPGPWQPASLTTTARTRRQGFCAYGPSPANDRLVAVLAVRASQELDAARQAEGVMQPMRTHSICSNARRRGPGGHSTPGNGRRRNQHPVRAHK